MPTFPNTHALLIGIADHQHVNPLPQQVRNVEAPQGSQDEPGCW